MDDLHMDFVKEFQKISDAFCKSFQLSMTNRLSEISKALENPIKECTKNASFAIESMMKMHIESFDKIRKSVVKIAESLQLNTPKYDFTPMLEALAEINLKADDEISIKFDDDEIELINEIDSSSATTKGKHWSFDKIYNLIILLLTIFQFFQTQYLSQQTSDQLDEISAKIEEHQIDKNKQAEENKVYQEKIISLLETITSQLLENENQSSDEESSFSLSE